MADAPSFAKFVPGFDFLQGLVKNAGAALPAIGQWVAPTLNPEELEKRIGELRTVQFWLEQNARLLGATIQALEVQRMTLSTLKTMNVQMGDLRESLRIRMPDMSAPSPVAQVPADPLPAQAAGAAAAPAAPKSGARKKGADAAAQSGTAPAAVDPLQWWGALTKQFTELATNAIKDSATDAAKNRAANAIEQSADAAGTTLRKAVPGATGAARKAPAKPRRRAAAKR
ncbi:MAG TPA: PhaM family polyhydroxyalkanoate granule multifunctional regulatory protein [Caldimonas sp.]